MSREPSPEALAWAACEMNAIGARQRELAHAFDAGTSTEKARAEEFERKYEELLAQSFAFAERIGEAFHAPATSSPRK